MMNFSNTCEVYLKTIKKTIKKIFFTEENFYLNKIK